MNAKALSAIGAIAIALSLAGSALAREYKTLREVVRDFRLITGTTVVILLKPRAAPAAEGTVILEDAEGTTMRATVPNALKNEIAEMKTDRFYTLVIFLRHLGSDGILEGLVAEKAD